MYNYFDDIKAIEHFIKEHFKEPNLNMSKNEFDRTSIVYNEMLSFIVLLQENFTVDPEEMLMEQILKYGRFINNTKVKRKEQMYKDIVKAYTDVLKFLGKENNNDL